jgi:hypothetical protein
VDRVTVESASARRALLERLIDHAALFPPASLPMDAAIEVDRAARAWPEAWVVNRFIVPASKLRDVPVGFEPRLSLVLDVSELPELAGTAVEIVETRLEKADAVADAGVPVFLEVWPGDDAKLREVADRGASAKVRCGGPTPDMFPSPGELAAFIVGCRDLALRFKATAGLHHPIRDGIAHGFLNLLAAAAFAHAGADEHELIEVLLEDDASAFSLSDGTFAVRGRELSAGAIAAARTALFVGYGSCSLSEPVEDLKALRIL